MQIYIFSTELSKKNNIFPTELLKEVHTFPTEHGTLSLTYHRLTSQKGILYD